MMRAIGLLGPCLTVLFLLVALPHTQAESLRLHTSRFIGNNTRNQSLCERIHPEELPEECSCRESGKWHLVVECNKVFQSPEFNDTIGLQIDINPCNPKGSSVSLDVTEKEHNITFSMAGIRAGEEVNIPIPGLAFVVPVVGHAGLDVAVLVTGNPDSLTMNIGLNACAAIGPHVKCASSIPGLNLIFPWYVLHGTYTFGDICEQKEVLETVVAEEITRL